MSYWGSSGKDSLSSRGGPENEKKIGGFLIEFSEEFGILSRKGLERGEWEAQSGEGGGPRSPQALGNGAETFRKGFICHSKFLPTSGVKRAD